MNDSLSKITSIIESAKDLSMEAFSASTRLIDSQGGTTAPEEISKLLNSRSNRDVLNGMKCVTTIVSKGEDGLFYFADVVKNITSDNAKIRQLVIVYLTKFADAEADTALLSINSIQKSLTDKSPANRAIAIRALAGIKISSIVPIVTLSLKRASTDPSALTRAAAAISIGKIYGIAGKSKKQIYEILGKLLSDSDVVVVSAAIKSYSRIRQNELGNQHDATKWQHIHGNFRRFCALLTRFDEWAQVYAIDIMTEYCRKFIAKPSKDTMDADLQLYLSSLRPLVQSLSPMVVVGVAKATYLLSPATFAEYRMETMLCRIGTRDSSKFAAFALEVVALICEKDASLFAAEFRSFYLFPDDLDEVARLKLDILSLLSTEDNFKYIFEELKYYSMNSNDEMSSKAIKAMANCSRLSPQWNESILNWCLSKIEKLKGDLLIELLTVIRFIVQEMYDTNPIAEKRNILRIMNKLASILRTSALEMDAEAKASILWTIGEYTAFVENSIGPDVLRLMLKSFANQAEPVRYQLLVLASKVYAYQLITLASDVESGKSDKEAVGLILQQSVEFKMFQHTLQLAKYDVSYDTRDRARMFSALLNSGLERAQLASLILQVPKLIPLVNPESMNTNENGMRSYFTEPAWTEDTGALPPSSIRTEAPIQYNKLSDRAMFASSEKARSPSPITDKAISSSQIQSSVNRAKFEQQKQKTYQLQSLDDFFKSEEESSSEEEEEEGEEEEVEEDDDDDDDDDEEEEEEEEEDDDDGDGDSDEDSDDGTDHDNDAGDAHSNGYSKFKK
ncbi:uncharacterized protein LODBEIA_P51410 [Lodderomyces beijingensis]|uniref:Clathrin/coatomer adaptor adaptin-like N-terminal domain-containing protein n=1 Tax=Lodderomyces beijingensis TaxID=1775926 RepID=A0ABP0ZS16_9ASCO